jgi:hypothetical protein
VSFPFTQQRARLTFDELVAKTREVMAGLPEKRTGKNTQYEMVDAALGAFAVFFTQSPSFLAFQRDMERTKGTSNAHTLFGIGRIPTDNHIRNLLDAVPASTLFPLFEYVRTALGELGHLEPLRALHGDVLVALDGTHYHSSESIHCPQCKCTHHANGTVTYSHEAITPVITAPGHSRVIPLEPEFITPQDGHDKQDCENAAAKRWLAQHGAWLKALGTTVLGDDLYCRQPLCEAVLAEGLNFLFVCKPDSHPTLYEWVEGLERTGGVHTVVHPRRHGKTRYTDTYRFVDEVPLREGEDALRVSWCELTTTDAHGKVLYRNAFATNHPITEANVADTVRAGRTRWKVENENNNTLKNHGYNLEHNFGHGKQHLSTTLLTLNLLAFLYHTVLELMDANYQLVRQALGTRKTFFDDIRAITRYWCFESWDALLAFMIHGLELEPPDTS